MAVTEHMPQGQRVIGRYVLYEEIASGGMATVHFGRMQGQVGFSRTVAIKCLHAQFAKEPDFVSMFIDEARVAGRIQHPNVVPMLDVVALQGELFLVMEFIQGESLSRLLRAARATGELVPVPIVTNIVAGVLDGLHAAHEALSQRGEPLGIVHRDVSPQNVIVGADGVARVLDFGVAKAAGRLQTTRDGQLKGKLAYMAPEQLRGEAVDRRTDIYAASVVLWEALTGRRLFDADNQAALFGLVLAGATEPPSRHRPSLPAGLDRVVMRGLTADPEQRYATAREMASALEEVVAPSSPREVAAWVEQFAGESLKRRGERLAEIESISEVHPGVVSGQPSTPSIAPPPAEGALPPTRPEVDRASLAPAAPARPGSGELSERSLTSLSTAQSILPRLRGGGRARNIAVMALLGVVAVVGLVWLLRSSPARSPAPVSSVGVLAATAQPSVAPSLTPSARTTAPTVSASPAPAASTSAPPPARHVHHYRHYRSPKHARPSRDCSPPYTLDPHGIRIPKPECL